MRLYKVSIVFLSIIIIAVVTLTAALPKEQRLVAAAAGQEDRWKFALDNIMRPFDAAPEESDAQKRAARKSKNRRYNHSSPRALDLTKQEDGHISGRVDESPYPLPLPMETSDLIILGSVTKRQPYLSENNTSIYTEFNVQTEEVLKQRARSPVKAKDVVVAEREGGGIRLPDGRVTRHFVDGIGFMPEVGKRYVLFLKTNVGDEDYTIVCSYELRADRIIPLEDISDRAPYLGLTEKEFLQVVKEAIAKTKQPSRAGGFF
jgi:hypothetical protein